MPSCTYASGPREDSMSVSQAAFGFPTAPRHAAGRVVLRVLPFARTLAGRGRRGCAGSVRAHGAPTSSIARVVDAATTSSSGRSFRWRTRPARPWPRAVSRVAGANTRSSGWPLIDAASSSSVSGRVAGRRCRRCEAYSRSPRQPRRCRDDQEPQHAVFIRCHFHLRPQVMARTRLNVMRLSFYSGRLPGVSSIPARALAPGSLTDARPRPRAGRELVVVDLKWSAPATRSSW